MNNQEFTEEEVLEQWLMLKTADYFLITFNHQEVPLKIIPEHYGT